MKRDLKKYAKPGAGATAALAAVLVLALLLRGDRPAWESYETMVERYHMVRQTEHSELKGVLEEVVRERLSCYAGFSAYDKRLVTCRKEYMNRILEIARHHVKSSPSLGEFMLCVRDCPLAYSMCRGEGEGGTYDPAECIEAEIQCVEWCLDAFWRGDGMEEKK